MALSFSEHGLGELSRNYHHGFRNHLCRGKYKTIPRPVLLNNWEATCFDFTGDKILEIAKQASDLGVEMLVLYDFLERLVKRYPDLPIEGCSGGGGRFDAGMLYYTPQIWCSDNTDAIDRIRIQYGTSFGYPVSAVGSHVSAVPNHQTGRITPMKTRGVVAMAIR